MLEWGWLLDQVHPNLTKDAFAPVLAGRLAAISGTGVDASPLSISPPPRLGRCPMTMPPPRWWRISRHLTPTITAHVGTDRTLAGALPSG